MRDRSGFYLPLSSGGSSSVGGPGFRVSACPALGRECTLSLLWESSVMRALYYCGGHRLGLADGRRRLLAPRSSGRLVNVSMIAWAKSVFMRPF